MTVKGFLFLLAVTMAAIALGALVGDRVAAPGFERTVVVAIVAAPIVFLAGRFAEHRGWVSGYFSLDRSGDRAGPAAHASATAPAPASDAERATAAPSPSAERATAAREADDRSPGDPK